VKNSTRNWETATPLAAIVSPLSQLLHGIAKLASNLRDLALAEVHTIVV